MGRREAEDWVRRAQQSYQRNGFRLVGSSSQGLGRARRPVGLVAQEVEGKNEVEIGYLFLKKFWGRSLAIEAAQTCRDHSFEDLEYDRLVSFRPRLP
jgi:[ribosomal protein S5]-alanine N-acetyltransferase